MCADRQFEEDGPAAGGADAELQEGELHPKWAGLRASGSVSGATSLPPGTGTVDLSSFKPQPWGEHFPARWVDKLGYRGEERRLVAELEAAVSSLEGPKDPMTMLRFLRARQGSVTKATTMYRYASSWYKAEDLVGRYRRGEIDDTLHRRLDDYWKLIGMVGRDREGSPIMWERIGQSHTQTLTQLPLSFVERHEVYSNVRMLQAMEELSLRDDRPHMYFTVVSDMEGLGLRHMARAVLQMYKTIVRVDEDFFPEMLKRVVVVRAPWIFDKIWVIVKHFFDEGTRAKIQIVSKNSTLKVLSEYIEPKYIARALGGECELGGGEFMEPFVSVGRGAVPRDLHEAILQDCAKEIASRLWPES